MTRRKRAQRGVCEIDDGDWALGGLVAARWRELVRSENAPQRLARMLAHAQARAAEGSAVHAAIAAELERNLADLRAQRAAGTETTVSAVGTLVASMDAEDRADGADGTETTHEREGDAELRAGQGALAAHHPGRAERPTKRVVGGGRRGR